MSYGLIVSIAQMVCISQKRGERGEGEYGGKNIGSVKSVVLLVLVI